MVRPIGLCHRLHGGNRDNETKHLGQRDHFHAVPGHHHVTYQQVGKESSAEHPPESTRLGGKGTKSIDETKPTDETKSTDGTKSAKVTWKPLGRCLGPPRAAVCDRHPLFLRRVDGVHDANHERCCRLLPGGLMGGYSDPSAAQRDGRTNGPKGRRPTLPERSHKPRPPRATSYMFVE